MVDIKLIKEVRQKTGLSILQCKKYLEKYKSVDLACYFLKKDNLIISKNNDLQINGIVIVKKINNYCILIQLNCLSDFVAKNKLFVQLANEIVNFIFLYNKKDIDSIKKITFNRINYIQNKFGEKIDLYNCFIKKNSDCYQHKNRIGIIVNFFDKQNNSILKKKILMHITSLDNEFLSIFEINYIKFNSIIDILKNKKNFYKELTNYFLNNILLNQIFIFNKINIYNILFINKMMILNYFKLKV